MPDLGIPRENIVFISGIGCSSRFPYYMNTYGFHTIHGRAPAIATGLKVARPDLKVFVVTGDGDGLSIGGNHMLHVLRRNVDLTILLFNNRIYGLTKGQYSPTSELGKVTEVHADGLRRSSGGPALVRARVRRHVRRPHGRPRHSPHGRDAEARRRAQGYRVLEILQNCNVYNDLAWGPMYDKATKANIELRLEHGKPLLFGPPDDRKAVVMKGVQPTIVKASGTPESDMWVHDEKSSNAAKLLANLFFPDFPCPSARSSTSRRPSTRPRCSTRKSVRSPSAARATSRSS
jgi:2-oxoglutarate ferredoxin oxidoreductase subunit beta